MHQIIKKYLFVTWVFIVLLIHYHFNFFKRAMLQLTFLQVFLVQMNDSKYMENKFFTFSSIFYFKSSREIQRSTLLYKHTQYKNFSS